MRRTAKVVGIVLALVVVALVSLPFLISADRFKPTLESKLSAALGRQVSVGSLRVSLLAGGVTANSLAIADDPAFGTAPFLKAESLKVQVNMKDLIFSRKLNVEGLTIEQPQVALIQSPAGRWNYSSLGGTTTKPAAPAREPAAAGSVDLSARLIKIVDGRFSMGKTGGRQKPLVLEKVNLEVKDFARSAEFPFSFDARLAGGGDIKLEGKAGPIDATDVEFTPLSVTLDVAKLNLASALGGSVPGIAGIASLQASGTSSGGRLSMRGKLKADGLKLARNGTPARRTVEFDFVNGHDLRTKAGKLQSGDIRVGAAKASLAGTYAERGDDLVLDMKFAGTKMPVPELAELLPPLGIALPRGSRLEGGTATTAFTVQGPSDHIVADGAVSFDKTRLANFDLGTKMTMIQQLAGMKTGPDTDIEVLSTKLKYTSQGTAVDSLHLIAPGIGELNGGGTVSASNALDFKMSATLQTTRLALLSKTAVPFFIQGTATDPVFKPDVQGLAKTQTKALIQSEAQKRLGDKAGAAATGILDSLFGGKKKQTK
ncbi:MAG: AsmA family protein [Acidobacteriales bacterium]|nr:AsmA family protein [Terriglobales bacterium]